MHFLKHLRNMHFLKHLRNIHRNLDIAEKIVLVQARSLQTAVAQKSKIKRYKYPAVYDPYGPRPPPSEKVTQLADKIVALTVEERAQIGPALREILKHPKLEKISTEGLDLGGPAGAPAAQAEEKKEEKTVFDVKLDKFDSAAKIKVIKEVRALTNLGLKEAKDLVEKAPTILKQGVTKEEAEGMIEKIKAAGGVAVME